MSLYNAVVKVVIGFELGLMNWFWTLPWGESGGRLYIFIYSRGVNVEIKFIHQRKSNGGNKKSYVPQTDLIRQLSEHSFWLNKSPCLKIKVFESWNIKINVLKFLNTKSFCWIDKMLMRWMENILTISSIISNTYIHT